MWPTNEALEGADYDARTTRPHTHGLKVRDKLPSPVEHLSNLWRRNVAALAPTPKRCRLPGKRCRFEESTSLLIVETGLMLATLVLSLVGIIMNTIYHRILKRSRLYGSFRLCVRTITEQASAEEAGHNH